MAGISLAQWEQIMRGALAIILGFRATTKSYQNLSGAEGRKAFLRREYIIARLLSPRLSF
jgi:hypothetical protein